MCLGNKAHCLLTLYIITKYLTYFLYKQFIRGDKYYKNKGYMPLFLCLRCQKLKICNVNGIVNWTYAHAFFLQNSTKLVILFH